MILHLLSLGFFILLWLMAVKGLVEAAGPVTRRLTMLLSRLPARQHHKGAGLPAQALAARG